MPATKKSTTVKRTASKGFTAEEREAMRERAREAKLGDADGAADLRAKIEAMTGSDRAMAERVHEIVMAAAPDLAPRTWYGMPAYAKNGKVLCFFQPAAKFKARYATIGFNEDAKLDDGVMWPTSWALTELTADSEALIRTLVRRAAA